MIAYPSQYYHAIFDFEFMSVNVRLCPNFELCKRARGKVKISNLIYVYEDLHKYKYELVINIARLHILLVVVGQGLCGWMIHDSDDHERACMNTK